MNPQGKLFSWDDYAKRSNDQSDYYKSVRCFGHLQPCLTTPFSNMNGVVWRKSMNATKKHVITLSRDYRGFDYKMRGVNFKTHNMTESALIYCAGNSDPNCDPGLGDFSPMVYKTVNYKYTMVSSGQGGAIVDIDPSHIVQHNQDRAILLKLDQMGSSPLECVYNGVPSGYLAKVVSTYVADQKRAGDVVRGSYRGKSYCECVLPAEYVMGLDIHEVLIGLRSPNATWTSNEIPLRILREGIPVGSLASS
jgi:hypothetical protein